MQVIRGSRVPGAHFPGFQSEAFGGGRGAVGESPWGGHAGGLRGGGGGSRARRVRERERWRRRGGGGGGGAVCGVPRFGPGRGGTRGREAGVCVWGPCWGTGAGPWPSCRGSPGRPGLLTAALRCSRSWLPAGTLTLRAPPGARWHPEPRRPGGKWRPPPCLRSWLMQRSWAAREEGEGEGEGRREGRRGGEVGGRLGGRGWRGGCGGWVPLVAPCAAGPEGRCLDAGRTPGSCLLPGPLGGS